jgi:hypothetical protein
MEMDLEVVPTGKTTATVVLTQEQVDALRGAPGMARVPLAITYEGITHRTSISRYLGQWMMVVNAAMRDAGLVPGAVYRCEVVRDDTPREVEVPDDLRDGLVAAGVLSGWEGLSYSRRRELAGAIAEAKRPETRSKRVGLAVAAASGAASAVDSAPVDSAAAEVPAAVDSAAAEVPAAESTNDRKID